VIVLSTVPITVGMPPVGILLLPSADRIPDTVRTAANVAGEPAASCAFGRITGRQLAGPADQPKFKRASSDLCYWPSIP